MSITKSHLCLICNFVIILMFTLCSTSYAIDFAKKNENELSGYSSETDINFSVRYSSTDIVQIDLDLIFSEKKVVVNKGVGKKQNYIRILGYLIVNHAVTTITKEDSERVKKFLELMLKENLNVGPLTDTFLATLNLIYSWPEGKLLDKTIGKRATQQQEDFFSICYDINNSHDGQYIDFNWIKHDETIYVTEIVGPYPFEDGDCFGRCGRGCVGDGTPNNAVNRFTQDCFNHDACARDLGTIAYNCNLIFDLCIDDFYSAPSCTPVLRVIIEPYRAVKAGAQWQVSPDPYSTGWHNSGDTIEWLPAGDYNVSFKSIEGYNAPPIQSVTITPGQLTNITATYTTGREVSGQIGCIDQPGQIFFENLYLTGNDEYSIQFAGYDYDGTPLYFELEGTNTNWFVETLGSWTKIIVPNWTYKLCP